jgi:hypothetical protein
MYNKIFHTSKIVSKNEGFLFSVQHAVAATKRKIHEVHKRCNYTATIQHIQKKFLAITGSVHLYRCMRLVKKLAMNIQLSTG